MLENIMETLTYTRLLHSLEDMQQLASALASEVDAGFVIALDGDLGAGKTTFSQAFAKGLGVTDVVNSPTFTIIKEYNGTTLPFYHMDVYRISVDEADELGLDDYFFGQGITIVEWASIIEDIFPAQHLHMKIEILPDNVRQITFKAFGQRYIEALQRLKNRGNN